LQFRKGPTNIEPGQQESAQSFIIENEEYNQEFCEQLNNQYSCLSTLHLTCKEDGLLWSDPVEKELILDGLDVYYHHRNWLYEEKKRRKLWGRLTERLRWPNLSRLKIRKLEIQFAS
jgi:hypothetical protein